MTRTLAAGETSPGCGSAEMRGTNQARWAVGSTTVTTAAPRILAARAAIVHAPTRMPTYGVTASSSGVLAYGVTASSGGSAVSQPAARGMVRSAGQATAP